LSAGFCRYSAGGVSTATVKYAFTISAGQTFSQRWPYASPGRYSPSGTTPCLRGVLKVGPDAFSTRVVC